MDVSLLNIDDGVFEVNWPLIDAIELLLQLLEDVCGSEDVGAEKVV